MSITFLTQEDLDPLVQGANADALHYHALLGIGAVDDAALVAGEALSDGDAVSIYDKIELDHSNENSDDLDFGRSSVQVSAAKITFGSAVTVKEITIKITKFGTPSDSVKVGIQADSSGNPSGTFLGSFTKAAADFTSQVSFREQLDASVTLSASTTYWVVFVRTGSIDNTNFYGARDGGSYASGESKSFDGSAWNSHVFRINKILWGSVGIYKAKATAAADANGYLGIMNASVASGAALAAGSLRTHGLKRKTGWGLTPGGIYYLSDTPGAIATSPGTVTKKIGVSVSSEGLVLYNTL